MRFSPFDRLFLGDPAGSFLRWKGGGGSAGGGGASGKVDYPSYMKDQHKSWLNDMDDIVDQMRHGPSPYAAVYAYDPTDDIEDMDERHGLFAVLAEAIDAKTDWDGLLTQVLSSFEAANLIGSGAPEDVESETFRAAVDGLAPQTDWESAIAGAKSKIDDLDLSNDDELEAMVSAYESQQSIQHAKALSRFNAGMADINAVMSSAFVVGQSLLESQRQSDVGTFRSNALLQLRKDRQGYILPSVEQILRGQQFQTEQKRAIMAAKMDIGRVHGVMILQSTADLIRIYGARLESEKALLTARMEISRMAIVSQRERLDTELEITTKDAMWDLNLYAPAGNLLASIGGGTVHPDDTTKMRSGSSALVNGVGGAISGAMMGAPAGPPGMIAGAIIGGSLGYFGS